MNHHVPEFDVDELYSAPSSSQSRHKNMQENEIMELVWHNGHLGVQNQNKRLLRKPSPPSKSQQNHQPPSHLTLPPPETASSTQLFMQEDEMTSWLHYPLDDDNSFDHHLTDLLYHPPPPSAAPPSSSARVTPPTELRPPAPAPQPQSRPPAHPSTGGINFPQFARQKARVPESGQSASSRNNERRNSTVVASNDTPKLRSAMNASGDDSAIAGTSTAGGYMNDTPKSRNTYAASISGGSATATADLMPQPPADDRKRKGIESVDAVTTKYQSEDLEIESCEAKKQCRGTASGKRTRAAEVHNLSERKRRDRINEKMKALQELIPRCTKTDKASMLDEAIDYLKSLQMQLQMMSMGYYSMVPMMFPGVQQYMPMPPMGLGMGMGMDTRMNRPMVPFPAPVAPSSMDPRFQFPNFPPPVPPFDPSRFQNNPMEPVCNPNEPPCPNVYQQYLGAQQNTPISIPSTSKASTSLDAEDDDNNPSGTGISIGE